MFAYLVIFLFVSFSYVTCPDYEEEPVPAVMLNYFDKLWNCSNICKDTQKEAFVKDICVELGKNVQDAYSEEKIRNDSGCKNVQVKLFSKIDNEIIVPREMGICYLSAGNDDKCISMGREADDLMIWSRTRVELNAPKFKGLACEPKKNLKGYWKNKINEEPKNDSKEGSTSTDHSKDQSTSTDNLKEGPTSTDYSKEESTSIDQSKKI